MNEPIFNSSRVFQMWYFTVGHGRLLLRSTKEKDVATRIDIFIKNVGAIHLPALLNGLAISEATEPEILALQVQMEASRPSGRKVFTVRGSNFAGYIVASGISWHEDELEYDDPSYFEDALS